MREEQNIAIRSHHIVMAIRQYSRKFFERIHTLTLTNVLFDCMAFDCTKAWTFLSTLFHYLSYLICSIWDIQICNAICITFFIFQATKNWTTNWWSLSVYLLFINHTFSSVWFGSLLAFYFLNFFVMAGTRCMPVNLCVACSVCLLWNRRENKKLSTHTVNVN